MPIPPPRRVRRVAPPVLPRVLGLALGLALVGSAVAQPAFLRPRSTVITDARVHLGDGRVIESGTVVVQRGRIARVVDGELDEMPARATVIDADGRTLTPGLIDVHSRLGLTDTSGSGPLNRAADAFDRYDRTAIEEALAQGVTTIYLPALGESVSGLGAVVHLGESVAMAEGAEALHVNFASELPAIRRLQHLEGIRKAFADAKAWRESVELYEDELLPDYEEKLAERAKKKDEEAGEDDGDGEDAARRRRGRGASVAGGEDLQPRPIRRGRGGRGGGGGGGGGEAPKKPTEPRPDRAAEVLLRAIDGEIPVRVIAHRSEDILNAMELAEEFGLELIIEGGSEAHLLAGALAEAGVRVVAGSAAATSPYVRDRHQTRDPHALTTLDGAGVDWAVGSGGPAGATRFVLLNAQLAAAGTGDDPLALVTSDAARFLGLDGAGVIRRGARADLVLWTADPLDPAASVASVWVEGRPAFERETD